MSLRDVTKVNQAPDTTLQMQRVLITDDSIITMWRARTAGQPDKTDLRVEVSPAALAILQGRASFQNMLDQIANDTSGRVPL